MFPGLTRAGPRGDMPKLIYLKFELTAWRILPADNSGDARRSDPSQSGREYEVLTTIGRWMAVTLVGFASVGGQFARVDLSLVW